MCNNCKRNIFLFLPFSFSINAYKVTGQFPWSSLRETDRGISTEISVKTIHQVLLIDFLDVKVIFLKCLSLPCYSELPR